MPSQKMLFSESLLADALVETTVPVSIAAAPASEAPESMPRNSEGQLAFNVLVVFGPRSHLPGDEQNQQVKLISASQVLWAFCASASPLAQQICWL